MDCVPLLARLMGFVPHTLCSVFAAFMQNGPDVARPCRSWPPSRRAIVLGNTILCRNSATVKRASGSP